MSKKTQETAAAQEDTLAPATDAPQAEAPETKDEPEATSAPDTGGALVAANGEVEEVEAEKVEPFETVDVPVHFLQAALTCASTEETRYYLNGVFVHRVENRVRIVATDGHRLFVAASEPTLTMGEDEEHKFPAWLEDGVIVSSERLAPKLNMLAKLSDVPTVKLSFARGASRLFLSDMADEAVFKCAPVDGTFPDYQTLLGSITGGVSVESEVQRGDFEPVTFSGKYLKAVGDLSKILGGKDAAVSVYAATKSDAALMTFPEAPGAMLLLMPRRGDGPIHSETVALLAPAVKGTLAALRAHLTRNQEAAEAATDPVEKARYLDKANEYERRIADLLQRTLEQPALPAPKAEAEGEPQETGELVEGQPLGTEETETEAQGDEPHAEEQAAEEPQAEATEPPQGTEPEAPTEPQAPAEEAPTSAPEAQPETQADKPAGTKSRRERRAEARAKKAA